MSSRGIETLSRADVIACEDTRRTGRLLAHLGIVGKELLVANEHVEARAAERIVGLIGLGKQVALVTDAGMPAVSDPGRVIVAAVLDAGGKVEVAPGPTALMSALVLSGLTTSRFVFEGFLPRKGKERTSRLAEVGGEPRTVVLYESPHRIAATLNDLAAVCGPDRAAAVGRELTKLHEEVRRGSLRELALHFDDVGGRGEFVVVVEGHREKPRQFDDEDLRVLLDEERGRGVSTRDAVATVVSLTGEPKRRIYDLATGSSSP